MQIYITCFSFFYKQPDSKEMGVDMLFVFDAYSWQTSSLIANMHEAQQPIIRMSQGGS